MKTLDSYTAKALDAYPYDIEGTLEYLGYALSYNHDNVLALWLFGKVFANQINDHQLAKEYFREALASDMNALYIYPDFAEVLLQMEEYDETVKLIEYALTLKGINRAEMYSILVKMYEKQGNLTEALQSLKTLELLMLDDSYLTFVTKTKQRIKSKLKLLKSNKKGKKCKKK